jgi:predicted  nucleic acid-binding Zn-ribbon protein
MSKHKQQTWLDWDPPAADKSDEAAAAVRKVAAEIQRTVAGYEPPTPMSADERKALPAPARGREKRREAEHAAAIEALEREEGRLKDERRRLARLAAEQEKELHESKQRERDRVAAEKWRSTMADRERTLSARAAAAAQQKQHEQQRREAHVKHLEETVAGLDRWINPPKPPEPIYVEVEPEPPGAGALPTLPRWR